MIHDSAVTTYKNPELAPWALGTELDDVVHTDDPRLFDAREPLPHSHPITDIDNLLLVLSQKQPLGDYQPIGEYHIGLALPGEPVSF